MAAELVDFDVWEIHKTECDDCRWWKNGSTAAAVRLARDEHNALYHP